MSKFLKSLFLLLTAGVFSTTGWAVLPDPWVEWNPIQTGTPTASSTVGGVSASGWQIKQGGGTYTSGILTSVVGNMAPYIDTANADTNFFGYSGVPKTVVATISVPETSAVTDSTVRPLMAFASWNANGGFALTLESAIDNRITFGVAVSTEKYFANGKGSSPTKNDEICTLDYVVGSDLKIAIFFSSEGVKLYTVEGNTATHVKTWDGEAYKFASLHSNRITFGAPYHSDSNLTNLAYSLKSFAVYPNTDATTPLDFSAPTSTTATISGTVNASKISWDSVVPTASVDTTFSVTAPTTLTMDESITAHTLKIDGTGSLTIAKTDSNKLTAITTTTINADTTVNAGAASLGAVTLEDEKTITVADTTTVTSLTTTRGVLATSADMTITRDTGFFSGLKVLKVVGGTLTSDVTDSNGNNLTYGRDVIVTGASSNLVINKGDGTGWNSGNNSITLTEGGKLTYNYRDTLKSPFKMSGGTVKFVANCANGSGRALDVYNSNASVNDFTVTALDGATVENPTVSYITALAEESDTSGNRKILLRDGDMIVDVAETAKLHVVAELISVMGNAGGTRGKLVKNGTGVLELAGLANIHETGTNINAGVLILSNQATLGSGTTTIAENAQLVIKQGTNKLTNTLTNNGTITADTATVDLTGATISGSGTYDVTNNGTLILKAGTENGASVTSGTLTLLLSETQLAKGYTANVASGTVVTFIKAGASGYETVAEDVTKYELPAKESEELSVTVGEGDGQSTAWSGVADLNYVYKNATLAIHFTANNQTFTFDNTLGVALTSLTVTAEAGVTGCTIELPATEGLVIATATVINTDVTVTGQGALGVATVASDKTLTLNGPIVTSAAGQGKLVKAGSGDLALDGSIANLISAYEVSAGKLTISNGGYYNAYNGGLQYSGTPFYQVGSDGHLVLDSHDLIGWNRSNTVTVAEVAGILEKTRDENETFSGRLLLKDSGELRLSAANDKFMLHNSAIIAVDNGASAKIAGNRLKMNGGTPEINVGENATLSGETFVELGTATKKTGAGLWVQKKAFSGNGALTIEGGTLRIDVNKGNDAANYAQMFTEGKVISVAQGAILDLHNGYGYFATAGVGLTKVTGDFYYGISGGNGTNTIATALEVTNGSTLYIRDWRAYQLTPPALRLDGAIVSENYGTTKKNFVVAPTILSGNGTIGTNELPIALSLPENGTIDAEHGAVAVTGTVTLPAAMTVKITEAQNVAGSVILLNAADVTIPDGQVVTVMVGKTKGANDYALVHEEGVLKLTVTEREVVEEESLMGAIVVKGSNASLTTKLTSGQMGDGEQWGVQIDMDATKPYGPGWQATQALKTFSVVRAKNDASQDWTNTTVSIVDVDTPETVLATSTVGVEETDYTLTYSGGGIEVRKLLTFTFATAVDLDASKTYQFRFNEARKIRMMHIQSISDNAKNTNAINVLNSSFVIEKSTEYTPIVELGVEIPALVINASVTPVDVEEVPTTLSLDTASFMGGYGTTYTVLNYTGEGVANWQGMTCYGLPEGAEVFTTDKTWGFIMKMIRVLPIGDSITAGLVTYHNSSANWHVAGGYRLPLYQYLTQAYGEGKVKYLGTSTYRTTDTGDNSQNSYEDRDIDSVTLTEVGQLNHEGHSGATLDGNNCQMYDRFKNQKVVDIIATQGTPDVITLHLGTNDFGMGGDTVESAQADMKKLLFLLNGSGTGEDGDIPLYPNATIFVAKIIPRSGDITTNKLKPFNEWLTKYVNELNSDKLVLVDLNMACNYGLLRHDGLHPSTEGYSRMAQNWFVNIEAALPPMGAAASIATVDARVANTLKVTTNKAINTLLTQTWTLNKGATVTAAKITDDKRTVILTVEGVVANTEYTLMATNLFAEADSVENTFITTIDIHTPTTDVVESDRAGAVNTAGVLKAAEWTTFAGFVTGYTSPIGYMPESGRPWQLDVRGPNVPTVTDGVLSLNGAPLTVNFKDGHIGTTKSVRTTVMEVSNLSAGDVLFTETGNSTELNKITVVDGDTLTWDSGSDKTIELASYGIDLTDDIPEVITETFAAIGGGYNCKLTINGVEVATSTWTSSGEWVNGPWSIGANSTANVGSATMKLYRLSFYEGAATIHKGTQATIDVGNGEGQFTTWSVAKEALNLSDTMESVTLNFGDKAEDDEVMPMSDALTFTFDGDGDVTTGTLTVVGSNGGTIEKTGTGAVTATTSTTINTKVAIEGQVQLDGITISEGAELAITHYAVLGDQVAGAGTLKITGATNWPFGRVKKVRDAEEWTGTVVLENITDSNLDVGMLVNETSSLTIEGEVKAYISACNMKTLTLNGEWYGNNGTTDSNLTQRAIIGTLTGDGTIYGHSVGDSAAYVDLVFTSAKEFTGTIDLSGARSAGTTVCFGQKARSPGQIVFTTDSDAIVPTGKTWTAVNGIYVHQDGTIAGNGTLAIPADKAFRYGSSKPSIFGGIITGVDADKDGQIEAEEYGNLVMELSAAEGHLTLSGDAHFATVTLNRSAGTGEAGLTLQCAMKVYKSLTYSNNFYLISSARDLGKVVVKSGATVVQPNTNAGGFKCAFDFEAGAIIDATALPFTTDLKFAAADTFKLPDEGAVIVKVATNQIFIKVTGTVETNHTGSLEERFTIKYIENGEVLEDTLDDRNGYLVEGRAYSDVSYGIQSMSVRQTSNLSEAALQEIAGLVYQAAYKMGEDSKDVTSVTNPKYADCFTGFSLISKDISVEDTSVTLYATLSISDIRVIGDQVYVAVKVTNGGYGWGEEYAEPAYLRTDSKVYVSARAGTEKQWDLKEPLTSEDLEDLGLIAEDGVYWCLAGDLPTIEEGKTSATLKYDVKAVNNGTQSQPEETDALQ